LFLYQDVESIFVRRYSKGTVLFSNAAAFDIQKLLPE